MHPVLSALESELRQLATSVRNATGDDRPASLMNNQWNSAGVDRHELAAIATQLADKILDGGTDDTPPNEALLSQYKERIQFLKNNTIPNLWNGNSAQSIPVYIITLDRLASALNVCLSVDSEKVAADVKAAKDLKTKLRALEVRVADMTPKVDVLQDMAAQIVQAHAAADQLPTDLASLREARDEIQSLREQGSKDHEAARALLLQMQEWDAKLQSCAQSAATIIVRCDDAMRASTSLGLAGAFHERAKSLTWSMTFWVVGLMGALGLGAVFGGKQLHQLADAIQATTPPMIIWTRLFVSLLSVGAPVWFAWLATKQIGQRFRLAEDYAYKASISKAYEGYRREAVELDGDFQTRLFSSALARLDEQPLRFVEHETHGSPWHEFLASDVIKEAFKVAPELAGKFLEMAKEQVAVAKNISITTKSQAKAETSAATSDSGTKPT